VVAGAEKTDPSRRSRVVIQATNRAGLQSTCDPVLTTLAGEEPVAFALHPSYPNPFNPSTTIRFDVPEQAPVRLVVFDVLGREVATLVQEELDAGSYEVEWNGTSDAGAPVAGGHSYGRKGYA
jgi:hypothetical protein